jgi:hypothetical protein
MRLRAVIGFNSLRSSKKSDEKSDKKSISKSDKAIHAAGWCQ